MCISFFIDAEKMLLAVDNKGQKIITFLPRKIALKLSLIEDKDRKGACDLSWFNGLKKDLLQQVGSYSLDFYNLETPPKVVVFCVTTTRHSDAVREKECVEHFFRERAFPCDVVENPTSAEIFSTIFNATQTELSGLIVFFMCHGQSGMLRVDDSSIKVQDIIDCMSTPKALKGKPKVYHHALSITNHV